MTLRRQWSDARRAKAGMPCRSCGYRGPTRELHHLVGRKYDRKAGATAYVHPDSVVPLCRTCHRSITHNEGPDLWGNLTDAEQHWCVERVGYGNARRIVSGRAWLDEINACNEAA